MTAPEFSRTVDIRGLTAKPMRIEADEAERKALAKRFDIVAIDRLEAVVSLAADGDAIEATGTLKAGVMQSCAVSGDDFPVSIREPLSLRFVPEGESGDEQVELEEEELDEIPYSGTAFDLGEAVAQSLALAIDPFATGPGANAARERAGIKDEDAPSGPLAEALAELKRTPR